MSLQPKIDIRCFVVVAIRNSPIETIQSDACGEAGLSKSLPSKEVKGKLHQRPFAISAKQDFAEVCRQAKLSARQDFVSGTRKMSTLSHGLR